MNIFTIEKDIAKRKGVIPNDEAGTYDYRSAWTRPMRLTLSKATRWQSLAVCMKDWNRSAQRCNSLITHQWKCLYLHVHAYKRLITSLGCHSFKYEVLDFWFCAEKMTRRQRKLGVPLFPNLISFKWSILLLQKRREKFGLAKERFYLHRQNGWSGRQPIIIFSFLRPGEGIH